MIKNAFTPRIMSVGAKQWRYCVSVDSIGVILKLATLAVFDWRMKPLFIVGFDFIEGPSIDVIESKLVKMMFRRIGAM